MLTTVNSIEDVIAFTEELVTVENVNLHPDTDFRDYINVDTGLDTYSADQAELRNMLMQQCFEICTREKANIYSLMHDIHLKSTGLDKLIPLSH